MKVEIIGAYQTKFAELWEQSLADLIKEAGSKALKDAEIEINQLDAVFLGNMLAANLANQNHLSSLIAEIFGVEVPVVRVEAACASGGVAVSRAVHSIAAGEHDNILVIGAEKMTDVDTDKVSESLMSAASRQERNSGLSFVGLYALMAAAYLEKYDYDPAVLDLPSIKNHLHAEKNPKAQFPFTIDQTKIEQSPMIACPLRLLHCSPVSDGAAAIVVSNNKQKSKATIIGSAQASCELNLSARKSLTSVRSTQKAAAGVFQQAGIGHQEVSLIELHDCFTIAELIAMEDLGFYQPGEAVLGYKKQQHQLGGKLPVNVSGGLKACGHPVGATGVKQIVELTNQLSGRAGKRQVKNAAYGLAHNLGGTGGTAVVHILKS
jgi:acetyl-CoA C-acetyltransferase